MKDLGLSRKKQHELKRALRTPKVLIVEDDISYEPIWRKVLESVDPSIEYQWCTSANEAQKILEETIKNGEHWDLVIADIFLSGSRTGLDLWEKCGEPVENMIIVSSVDYSKLLDYIGSTSSPPIYIKKPLQIQECITAVNDLIGGDLE